MIHSSIIRIDWFTSNICLNDDHQFFIYCPRSRTSLCHRLTKLKLLNCQCSSL
ncbi:hypothetical protein Mapa_013824 [Marchantia paleacea]|nr:hypothetical protein Mapa_013824 [Marchantia paleacea]